MDLKETMVQITTRLGAVTRKGLLRAVNQSGRVGRSTFYYNLAKARREGLIQYSCHPRTSLPALTATELSHQLVYGKTKEFAEVKSLISFTP